MSIFVTAQAHLSAQTLLPAQTPGEPFTPANDSTIVEVLPAAIVALSADMRATRSSGSAPMSPAQRLQRAANAYQLASSNGDARAYGRSLALLQNWPEDQTRPALFYILMAAVQQHNHEFQAALDSLDNILSPAATDVANSLTVQALLIQSQIGLVIGDYDMVADSCESLRARARHPVSLNCQTQLDGVVGNAEQALTRLDDALTNSDDLNIQDYLELFTTAATIAHRTGRPDLAQRYYQAALQMAPGYTYVLVNYSNFLLEQDRSGEVANLLAALPPTVMNTELEILLTDALMQDESSRNAERAVQLRQKLANEFELAFMREDAMPHKEYAQYTLTVAPDAELAFAAARKNWVLQKEPSDSLLLARAAVAANDTATLRELARWLQAAGTQDVRIASLLAPYREANL